MSEEWYRRIIDKFDFCKPDDVHAVTTTSRFRKNLKTQLKNNKGLQDYFVNDMQYFYGTDLWIKKALDTKQVGKIIYSRTKKKNKIWQTRTHKCGNGKGRIWFVYLDDEPDAPRPVILLLGCELTQKRESHNKRRISNLCNKGEVEIFDMPLMAQPSEAPDKGLIEEFEDDPDIRPMFHGDNYRAMIDLFDSEVGIRPTKKQLDTILHPDAPIFINGQAGTGKTVLLATRTALKFLAAFGDDEDWRTLTTCMSRKVVDRLRDNTKDVIVKLFRLKKAEMEFQTALLPESQEKWMKSDSARSAIFRAFSFIQYEIIDSDNQRRFDDPREDRRPRRIGFSRFSREFYSRRHYPMSSELAWYGIRSLIKGYAGRNEGEWLRVEDLKKHVSSRVLNIFEDKDLEALSACFYSYQRWLKGEKFYDDMDLARAAWDRLRSGELTIQPFDEVYLDEAQDLTDLEFRILLMLLKPERMKYAILAGDPLQTINPTGFDWPRIKEMMYQTLTNLTDEPVSISDPMTLTKNYRTPIEMVQLGNILLERRAHYQKETIPEQTSNTTTEKPIVLQIDEDDIDAITRLLAQPSDKRFIITYTIDNADIDAFIEKDPAAQKAQSEGHNVHIESVTDVKGLERDTIILYRFADNIGDPLRFITKIRNPAALNGSEKISVLYSLNRMYISLTRGRRYMYILDTKKGIEQFWNSGLFSDAQELLDCESIHDTTNILLNHPRFIEDIDPINYARQNRERFRETEDPKFLRWTISALEVVDSTQRDRDWSFLYYEADALLEESRAAATKNREKQQKHLKNAADCWSKFGNKPKQYKLLLKARYWSNALLVDCPKRDSENHLLQALISGATLSDDHITRLLDWVREGQRPEWLPEQNVRQIHIRVVEKLLSENNPEEIISVIREMAKPTFRNLWIERLVEHYKTHENHEDLKGILSELLEKYSESSTLRNGMRWCLRQELQPLVDGPPSDKRIKAREELAGYSEGKKKRDYLIEIALDHIELFINELNVNGVLIWGRVITKERAKKRLEIYKKSILKITDSKIDYIPTGRMHTFLIYHGMESVDCIAELVSLTTKNEEGMDYVQSSGFDTMRESILAAVTSPEFTRYCLGRATVVGDIKLKDLLDSENAVIHLIMAYKAMNAERKLLRRFKSMLVDDTELDRDGGGRKELRESLLTIWSKVCKSKRDEREVFTEVCVRLLDFDRLRKVAKIIGDDRMAMRASAEEVMVNVQPSKNDLRRARGLFIELGLQGRAQQAYNRIPKDPVIETKRHVTPKKGILGLADALELLIAEVTAGRLSNDEALNLVNERREVEGMDSVFCAILASPYCEKVSVFSKALRDIILPSIEEDPLMHDWFSLSIRETLFKFRGQQLSDDHMKSIWTRMKQQISMLVRAHSVGHSYEPIQRRFWSDLEGLTQEEKLASLAWFSLFNWLERTKPNKSVLVEFMDKLELNFKKSERVGTLRQILLSQTRPDHEKQTDRELKGAIKRLCG